MKALNKDALSKSTVRDWCKYFKNEGWSVEGQWRGDQISRRKTQKRVVVIDEVVREGKAWRLKALSAKD